MRPSRAKTPAARAAGGLHPGILASRYMNEQNVYDLIPQNINDLATQVLGASWADETLQPLQEVLPELLRGLQPGALLNIPLQFGSLQCLFRMVPISICTRLVVKHNFSFQ